jgi:hypothetical protein
MLLLPCPYFLREISVKSIKDFPAGNTTAVFWNLIARLTIQLDLAEDLP